MTANDRRSVSRAAKAKAERERRTRVRERETPQQREERAKKMSEAAAARETERRRQLVERDTRPTVPPADVAAVIAAAAKLVVDQLKTDRPRLEVGDRWGAVRAAFHVVPDDFRRAAIVRLILEEDDRIRHDAGASLTRHSDPRRAAEGGE